MSLANTGASAQKPAGAQSQGASHPGATSGGPKPAKPGAASTPLTR